MKKAVIKLLAATAIVLGTTSALFANGYCYNQSGYGYGRRHHGYNNMQNRGMHFNRNMMDSDILGNITSISTESNIITVKDIDGKESSVHINPLTNIFTVSNRSNESRNNNCQGNFSDIKTGDWVMIRKMGGETKTIEAAEIIVSKE
ncbi:MAG: hypothetical protein K6F69_01370 [Treponema sp.]|nr:hypothetical protein [Treponema sp.]